MNQSKESSTKTLTRREFLTLTGTALTFCGLCTLVGGAEAVYFYNRLSQLSSTQPEGLSIDTPPAVLAPNLATSPTLPNKDTLVITENPFHIGSFDFQGKDQQPAAPLFIFISRAEGTIKSYVIPKSLAATDDQNKMLDWHQPINLSFLNITGFKNGYAEGVVIQTGHSGTVKSVGELPMEALRKALEENSRPFNQQELAHTITNLKSANVAFLQGQLAPGFSPLYVNLGSKEALVKPVQGNAKIKEVIRLTPNQTADYNSAFQFGQPNLFEFTDQKVALNPTTDIGIFICGQKLFPGEKPNDAPFYSQTRYLVIFSLTK